MMTIKLSYFYASFSLHHINKLKEEHKVKKVIKMDISWFYPENLFQYIPAYIFTSLNLSKEKASNTHLKNNQ